MDEGRQIQLELFRRWTPVERVERGMELTALALAARDSRLRQQHPRATDEELRWIRVREVLGLEPNAPLP